LFGDWHFPLGRNLVSRIKGLTKFPVTDYQATLSVLVGLPSITNATQVVQKDLALIRPYWREVRIGQASKLRAPAFLSGAANLNREEGSVLGR